jgi:hypothetical protein
MRLTQLPVSAGTVFESHGSMAMHSGLGPELVVGVLIVTGPAGRRTVSARHRARPIQAHFDVLIGDKSRQYRTASRPLNANAPIKPGLSFVLA